MSGGDGFTNHLDPDGTVKKWIDPAGTIRVWDVDTGKEFDHSPTPRPVTWWNNRPFAHLTLTSDGSSFLSAVNSDNARTYPTVQVWETTEGKLRSKFSLPEFAPDVIALSCSSDGRRVLAQGEHGTRVWASRLPDRYLHATFGLIDRTTLQRARAFRVRPCGS